MKILFLDIETERDWNIAAIGPACIAAYVRQHGHEAGLQRISMNRAPQELIAAVRREAPDLLGFSLTTRQWPRARALMGILREATHLPIITGGLHPTFSPEAVWQDGSCDYICLGEGEETVRGLLDHLAAGKTPVDIPNLWSRSEPRPTPQPFQMPPDQWPPLARDLLAEPPGIIHMVTQRGCPFPCSYCAAGKIRALYATDVANRRRSPGHVIDELLHLRKKRALNFVIFLDDTFLLDKDWNAEFCALYGAHIRAPFSIQARVEIMTAPLLAELARAGCAHITYGVESGSLRVRREILKRPVENQRFIDVFRWTRQQGILATANYMLGIPGETPEDIEATLRLHMELMPGDFGYFVYYPFPGTALFTVCRDNGYLPENYAYLPVNHRQSVLRLPHLAAEDIERYYQVFTQLRQEQFRQRYGAAANAFILDATLKIITHAAQTA